MSQLLAIALVSASCLAGTVFLIAALRRKWVIRLDPTVVKMAGLFHILAASLFFGLPLMLYGRKMTWPLPAIWMGLTIATVVYACLSDARARRRQHTT